MSFSHKDFMEIYPGLCAYCVSLARRMNLDGEDIAQTVFLKAWNARDKFAPGTNLRAWLFTIARNHAFQAAREAGRAAKLDSEELLDPVSSTLSAPPQEQRFYLTQTFDQLAKLGDDKGDTLIFSVLGASHKTIGDLQGIAVGTVKSRINRARESLPAADYE